MVLDSFKLDGKVAIVTGCSTGLGQGMCLGLAEAGADVVGVDYVPAPETRAAVEKLGRRFHGVVADLLTIAPVERIMKEAVDAFGRLDILVNNAGIIRREDALSFSEKDWDDVMAINVKTVFFMSQAAARQFVGQGTGGKIINIASMLSFQGGIRVPSYTASKSGVDGHHEAHGERVGEARDHGQCDRTGLHGDEQHGTPPGGREEERRDTQRIPAGRWGLPEDLKGPVVFLASAASDYVTGYTIAVDGGWLAR